jgi:hypothetical protein
VDRAVNKVDMAPMSPGLRAGSNCPARLVLALSSGHSPVGPPSPASQTVGRAGVSPQVGDVHRTVVRSVRSGSSPNAPVRNA